MCVCVCVCVCVFNYHDFIFNGTSQTHCIKLVYQGLNRNDEVVSDTVKAFTAKAKAESRDLLHIFDLLVAYF